ncbi:hypothetical protein ABZW49_48950 [Nonomuraea wenchangensis]
MGHSTPRRWAVLTVAVLVASTPVPAQADTDPAGALKQHLRAGHGVRVSETTRITLGKRPSETRISGRLRLASAGPAAAQFTWWTVPRKETYRVIRVGSTVYDGANAHPGPIPDGKKWIRFPNKHRGVMARDMAADASQQPINVYDPSTLKAVLKRSTRKPGFLYQGTMSYQDLDKITKSPLFHWTSGRPIGPKSRGKITWKLWTGRDGTLKRLLTTDTEATLVKRTDTRYSAWGSRVVITAPPADEVIDEADLLEHIRNENEPIPEDEGNT